MSLPMRELIRESESLNIRLEMIGGLGVWEASPAFFHQWEVDRIRSSIRPVTGACGCVHVADVLFTFSDGSFKRPDIAVLCELPNPLETDEALNIIPGAVIEIISKNYEYKDLVLSPPFYLENGVKDILIFDPRSKVILHHRKEWTEPKQFSSPARFELECGCEVTI
jgi:Uma2 family endonuclease